MWSAEAVLVCAIGLLSRSAASLPPIQLVSHLPADVSPQAEAFVRHGDPRIHLLTSSQAFRDAQRSISKCGDIQALRKLASVIVHEEWHVNHPGDEQGAYNAQLTALTLLGAGLGNPLYQEVTRSRQAVLGRRGPRGMPRVASVAP